MLNIFPKCAWLLFTQEGTVQPGKITGDHVQTGEILMKVEYSIFNVS